jgi:hypothetical protein
MAKLTEKEEAAVQAMIRLEMGEPRTSGKSWQEEFGVPNEDVSRLMKIAHRRLRDRRARVPGSFEWRLRDPEFREASRASTFATFRSLLARGDGKPPEEIADLLRTAQSSSERYERIWEEKSREAEKILAQRRAKQRQRADLG